MMIVEMRMIMKHSLPLHLILTQVNILDTSHLHIVANMQQTITDNKLETIQG